MGVLDSFSNLINGFIGYETQAAANKTNKGIADQNLEFQRQRANIEDARYYDETNYNREWAENDRAYQRAWAADEREYQRALQQQIFDREDTALERQASSLSSMGINPLSQQLNGLGAGQALSPSASGASVAPSASTQDSEPLNNQYHEQAKDKFLPALTALADVASVVNGITTGTYQRDALQLENDRKYLENASMANKMGLQYVSGLGRNSRKKNSYLIASPFDEKYVDTNYGHYEREKAFDDVYMPHRDHIYKIDHNLFDAANPKINLINELATLDFGDLASRIITNASKTYNQFNDSKYKKGAGTFLNNLFNGLF